jgi:hypothetical protein
MRPKGATVKVYEFAWRDAAFPRLALKSDNWRNIPFTLRTRPWWGVLSEIACFEQLTETDAVMG